MTLLTCESFVPVGKFASTLCFLSRCEDSILMVEQAYLPLPPPLCSPQHSCVQYLYNTPWLFKMRKKSGGSGCRPRVFLFGITTLLEDQRESGALCLLMGRSPPTGSSTMCVHSLLPFNPQLFLISPSLLSHVSETSLNFMPPPYPPTHPQAPSISFLPSSSCVLVLNTTRTRTWVSGGAGASYITLWKIHTFLRTENRWRERGEERGCNCKLKITYRQVQNSLQCHFGSWDVESCHYTWSETSHPVHKSLKSGYTDPTLATAIMISTLFI